MLRGRVAAKQKTILVIESDEALRKCLFEILSKEGYRVVSIRNTTEGLRALEAKDLPAMIFFDLVRPELSDLTFLKQIRENSRLAAVPIIISCGSLDEKALELATSVIAKPYNMQTLLEVVERHSQP